MAYYRLTCFSPYGRIFRCFALFFWCLGPSGRKSYRRRGWRSDGSRNGRRGSGFVRGKGFVDRGGHNWSRDVWRYIQIFVRSFLRQNLLDHTPPLPGPVVRRHSWSHCPPLNSGGGLGSPLNCFGGFCNYGCESTLCGLLLKFFSWFDKRKNNFIQTPRQWIENVNVESL